ncbi:hypothetical protein [Mycobacterium sp. 050134]|uniref:hypothetical protein n=1 Tax=Mycobacterium sp. 050134 TaxID=3096111 RepID=UPI002EDA44AA
MRDDEPPRPHRLVAATLIGLAAAFSVGVAGAPSASADPSAFGALSCNCQETAAPGSPARKNEVARGIQQSLAGPSSQPGQALG